MQHKPASEDSDLNHNLPNLLKKISLFSLARATYQIMALEDEGEAAEIAKELADLNERALERSQSLLKQILADAAAQYGRPQVYEVISPVLSSLEHTRWRKH